MTSTAPTACAVDTVTSDEILERADALGLPERERAAWSRVSPGYRLNGVFVVAAGRLLAAALVTARPATAARKIVGAYVADGDSAELGGAVDALLERVIGAAVEAGAVVVTWQRDASVVAPSPQETMLLDAAARRGFAELRSPESSGAGSEGFAGSALWLNGWHAAELPYYRQTTEYSCGPVSLLLALPEDGRLTRDKELRLWRSATNLPGCEPVALGLAALDEGEAPSVFLSTTEPILLEYQSEPVEREMRAFMQRQDAEEAVRRGLPVERRLLGIDEVVDAVRAGHRVLLMIDQLLMSLEAGGHWILVHAVHDDVLIVQDPWLDADGGETWLDGHQLPIRTGDLDAMAWLGEPSYRGAVILPRR